MENLIDYSRQRDFDNSLTNIRKQQINYIVGCGGVGFWLGIMLAMQGQENFVLIDGQTIERSNLNRLPVPPTWIGHNKAVALRKMIRFVRPMTAIHVITEHIAEDTFSIITTGGPYHRLNDKDLRKTVWDCTDDARIQTKIFKAMRDASRYIGYRKLGYEGFQVGSYKAYDVWIPGDYAPGYRTSNACASTSALAAVLGIMTEGFNIEDDVEINIADIVHGRPPLTGPLAEGISALDGEELEAL